MKKIFLLRIVFFLVLSMFIFSFIPFRKNNDISPRNHNICKKLKGNVLVYLLWSGTKETFPWNDYDYNSTLDSVNVAIKWLEEQARNNGIDLKIQLDYYTNDSSRFIYQSFKGSIKKVLAKNSEGIIEVNRWADKVVKKASGQKTKAQFISSLRDKFSCESVVLIFAINNYFKPDFSCALNTRSEDEIEYSIIGTKNPVLIAQEILHLFGAPYLYEHHSTKDRRINKKLKTLFPDEVMAYPEKNIHSLNINEITAYYIGWRDDIKQEYQELITQQKSIY